MRIIASRGRMVSGRQRLPTNAQVYDQSRASVAPPPGIRGMTRGFGRTHPRTPPTEVHNNLPISRLHMTARTGRFPESTTNVR